MKRGGGLRENKQWGSRVIRKGVKKKVFFVPSGVRSRFSKQILERHLFYDVLIDGSQTVCERSQQPLTVFETIRANSSKLSLPSPSLSASIIVLSTICCN